MYGYMHYMVHDFEAMYHHNLQAHSGTILIGMAGASIFLPRRATESTSSRRRLASHLYNTPIKQKVWDSIRSYNGFEAKFTEPKRVFDDLLPEGNEAYYHWINTCPA
jgi:hypothetical protein